MKPTKLSPTMSDWLKYLGGYRGPGACGNAATDRALVKRGLVGPDGPDGKRGPITPEGWAVLATLGVFPPAQEPTPAPVVEAPPVPVQAPACRPLAGFCGKPLKDGSRNGLCDECQAFMDQVGNDEDPPVPPPNHLTCGCCSYGCCCEQHQDVPQGLTVKVCGYHAPLPYAPLDRTFRWDLKVNNYVRVPVPPAPLGYGDGGPMGPGERKIEADQQLIRGLV